MGRLEVRARRVHADGRPFQRRYPRDGHDAARKRRRHRARTLTASDRADGAPRRHRHRPRRERQRLGHRSDARAGTRLCEPGSGKQRLARHGACAQHHLPVHRRRRLRRARRTPVRVAFPVPEPRPGRRRHRRAGRQGHACDPVRGGCPALAARDARSDRGGAAEGAELGGAAPSRCSRPDDRSWFPVQPV